MQLETPPTPEWMQKNAGNKLRAAQVRSTGQEVIDCHMLAYRCPYDVLDEMDVLAHDYRHTVDMLFRASEGFRGRGLSAGEAGESGTEIRRYWLLILREMSKRDADYLAWLGSDIEHGLDLAGMRWGFCQTAAHTEALLQLAQKIALDFMRDFAVN